MSNLKPNKGKDTVPYVLIAVVVFLIATCFTFFVVTTHSKKVSYDDKTKSWLILNGYPEDKKVLWAKRQLTIVTADGKIQEVEVGLAPNGNFVWRYVVPKHLYSY